MTRAPDNPLALLWARKRMADLQHPALRRLAAEIRQQQIELAPLRERAEARRKANMRQDGPAGFVMVMK